MPRHHRRGLPSRPRAPRPGLTLLNLGLLVLLLVGVLVYKQIVADRAAGFIDQFAPPEEGTGDRGAAQLELTMEVTRSLLHRAVERASE